MRSVGDVMTKNVKTIAPDAPLFEAAKLMKKNRIGSVMIVEGDTPIGIITERDLAYKVMAEGKSSDTMVREVMSDDVKTITADRSLHDAAMIMAAHIIKYLPVVEGEKMVGIIDTSDILKAEEMGVDPREYP